MPRSKEQVEFDTERGSKLCYSCNEDKELSLYYRGSAAKDGKDTVCKMCRGKREKESAAMHPEKFRRKNQEVMWKRKFGITRKDYDKMFAEQKGGCAICGATRSSKMHEALSVDHCHTTGRIRGLLCANCNRGIGHLQDSSTLLRAAITYLDSSL